MNANAAYKNHSQSLEEYFPGLTNRTEGDLETMRSDAKAFAEDLILDSNSLLQVLHK